jgi:hypothetical protein
MLDHDVILFTIAITITITTSITITITTISCLATFCNTIRRCAVLDFDVL